MRLFRTSFALLLAAFWLLATQHCALEAAGVLSHGCQPPAGEHGCHDGDHASDACALVENGFYKSSANTVVVTAPSLVPLLACLLAATDAESRLDLNARVAVVGMERPRAWVPVWHFVQRAAPAPRAPSAA